MADHSDCNFAGRWSLLSPLAAEILLLVRRRHNWSPLFCPCFQQALPPRTPTNSGSCLQGGWTLAKGEAGPVPHPRAPGQAWREGCFNKPAGEIPTDQGVASWPERYPSLEVEQTSPTSALGSANCERTEDTKEAFSPRQWACSPWLI